METTTNYGLKKPAQEDFVNVEDINYNSDILDEKIAELEETAEGALPAEDYTAEDILEKIKTVDGAGSGLDADLFKGQSVVPVANGGTGVTNQNNIVVYRGMIDSPTDLDDVTTSGMYYINTSSITNYPPSLITSVVRHSLLFVEHATNNTIRQTYITCNYQAYDQTSKNVYYRLKFTDNDFTDWFEYITSGNIDSMLKGYFETGNAVIPIKNGGTGQTSLDDFMLCKSLPEAGEDGRKLSDIQEVGIYAISSGSVSFDDWPEEMGATYQWGVLEVQKGSQYKTQRLILTNGTTSGFKIWVRFFNTNSSLYTDWAQIMTYKDVLPVANGGTGLTSLDDFAMTRSNIGGNDVAIDLNDYTADGFYYVASHGKDISNYPPSISASVAQHSILIVERAGKGSTMRQTYIPCNYQAYDGYAKNVYYRLKFGNNDFTDWFEYATENNMARMMNAAFASGAMTAITVASDTAYTTAKVRNIQASTTDLTAGTSTLANGNIYLVYE